MVECLSNSDSFAPIDRHTNGTCEVLRMRLLVYAFLRNWCFTACDGIIANGTKLELRSMQYAKSLATIELPEDSLTMFTIW